jgi:membrane associated rhomboid family serine protease
MSFVATIGQFFKGVPVTLALMGILFIMFFKGKDLIDCNDKSFRQIFIHTFIHSNLLHLAFNMYALYQGMELEREYGSAVYAGLIAVLLVLTNYIEYEMTQLRVAGYWPFETCSIGFSAILLGVIIFDRLYKNKWVFDESIVRNIVILLVIPVIMNPKVSLTGHLAGILSAVLLALIVKFIIKP